MVVLRFFTVILFLSVAILAHAEENPAYLSHDLEIKSPKPLKIAYVIKAEDTGNPFWARVRAGAAKAAKDFGVEITVYVPDKETYDVAKQIKLLHNLSKTDIDGFVVIPIDTQALVEPVESIIAAGKPVVIHDTPLNSNKVLTQIFFDNYDAGLKIGTWINNKLAGEGEVVILEGQSHSLNAVERRNGFLAGLAKGHISIMDIRPADWNRQIAYNFVKDWLEAYPNLDAILASSSSMALGAMEALDDFDRDDILIVGIDGPQDIMNAINDGKIQATVDQVPEMQSRQAIQLLIRNIIQNETYPKVTIWKDSPLISADNVHNFLKDAPER